MNSVTIPLPLKVSLNKIYAGVHWTIRADHADLYHILIVKHKNLFTPVDTYTTPVSISYDFVFKGGPLDTTNCAYLAKLLEDGLVKSGVISADGWKHVVKTTLTSTNGKQDQVTITIC